jgi:APA family basic amino acid/polyamine antiporter
MWLQNVMYISVLPMKEIAFAKQDRVAVAAANEIFGNMAPTLLQ